MLYIKKYIYKNKKKVHNITVFVFLILEYSNRVISLFYQSGTYNPSLDLINY